MYSEALYVLIISLYYIRYVGLNDIKKNTINAVFKVGAKLVAAVSIGSVIANTLGYTNLSDVLLRIVIMGPAITVLAYGILFVLGGVVGTSLSIYFAEHPELDENASSAILSKTQTIVKWVAAAIWVVFILVSAELYRPLFSALELWLTEPWIFGEFSLTPGALLSFVFVIIVAFVITRAIAILIDGGVLDFIRLPKGTLSIISMVIRYFIVALAIAIALGTLGIDLSKFGLIAGALGVGIGFGLQNIVSNFISGMILTFEQPASPGDTIEVNGLMGVVKKIGVRSSMIRSFEGADIVIPNATLLSNDLVNWTRVDDQKRIEINVGVAYGSDPPEVRQILLQIVNDHPKVLNQPEPAAFFNEFGDSALNFRLLFWAPIGEWLDLQSQVASEIHKRFKEEGIQIPFPQQDVWLRNAKTEAEGDLEVTDDDAE
jgi:small-conductance mechanosensitive channel